MIVAEEALSVCEQCLLLGVARSSYYQQGGGESGTNMSLMRRMDELYTADPTWGSRKMRDRLRIEGLRWTPKARQRPAVLLFDQAAPSRQRSVYAMLGVRPPRDW